MSECLLPLSERKEHSLPQPAPRRFMKPEGEPGAFQSPGAGTPPAPACLHLLSQARVLATAGVVSLPMCSRRLSGSAWCVWCTVDDTVFQGCPASIAASVLPVGGELGP